MKRNLVVIIAKLRAMTGRTVHSENETTRTPRKAPLMVIENPAWVENYINAVRTACLRGTALSNLKRSRTLPGINYIVKARIS